MRLSVETQYYEERINRDAGGKAHEYWEGGYWWCTTYRNCNEDFNNVPRYVSYIVSAEKEAVYLVFWAQDCGTWRIKDK